MQGMASPISVAERGRRTLVTELDYFPMLEGICFARQWLHTVSEFIVAALQVPTMSFPQRFPEHEHVANGSIFGGVSVV